MRCATKVLLILLIAEISAEGETTAGNTTGKTAAQRRAEGLAGAHADHPADPLHPTDTVALKHNWKFLFDLAFSSLGGDEDISNTSRDVFKKAAGRLGYVYQKGTGYFDALKQYLSASVGFSQQPPDSQLASWSGKTVFLQALEDLKETTLRSLAAKQIGKVSDLLGEDHSHLVRTLVFLGLTITSLSIWTITAWAVKLVRKRRSVAKARRTLRAREAEDRVIGRNEDHLEALVRRQLRANQRGIEMVPMSPARVSTH